MRAIAYNIQPHEKELLTLANGKRHELTLISNELNDKTVVFAQGKDVVIVANASVLSYEIMMVMRRLGVEKVIIRSAGSLTPSMMAEAEQAGIQVVNTPASVESAVNTAQRTIEYLHHWESDKVVKNSLEKVLDPYGNANVTKKDAVKQRRYNR